MRSPPLLSAGLALVAISAPLAAQDAEEMPPDYRATYEALVDLRPDPSRVAGLTSPIVLDRPGLELALDRGQLSLLTLDGRVVGAAFSGAGSVTVDPPFQVSREQLERVMEAQTFRTAIKSAAFFFRDGTLAELEGALTFGAGDVEDETREVVEQAVDYARGDWDGWIDPHLMASLLNDLDNDFFHVHLRPEDGDELFYRYDGHRLEEASFGRDGPGDSYETVTRFHHEEHYADGSWVDESETSLAEIGSHWTEIRIDDDAITMWFDAEMEILPRSSGSAWVPMSLFGELRVDSARWRDGEPARLFRPDEESSLTWVQLPERAVADQPLFLLMSYRGDLGIRENDWYGLKTSTGWYLRSGDRLPYFDVTFHVPSELNVVAAGERVLRVDKGDTITTRWVTNEPARHASFSVGPFETSEYVDPRVPPLTIQVQRAGHERLLDAGVIQQANMAEKVGLDVANALAFYQRVYGPVDATKFYVAEIPYGHGQAFPGMIHLSFATYLLTRSEGYDESFRAHEVAHQWWGLGVGEKSPRDAWLEEGLSEFSSLWYMLKVKLDPERVYELLEEHRDAIFDVEDDAGPVWLGRYHGSRPREGGEHYQAIVYSKGAWVFHMLRMLAMDLPTQDDSEFQAAMQSLYETYKGKRLSTPELQEHLERELDTDLGWFFDQWVYGTDIPRYHFSYTGRETASGEYEMVGKVRQEDVPDDFQMYVPVLLDFGEEGFTRVRVHVRGPESTVEFPTLPREPDRVVFNDLHGVLAEVDTGDWEGPDPWER